MHSERKKPKEVKERLPSKDYSMAEKEIEDFNANRNSAVRVHRSQSSYSLPPRPKSTHGYPIRSPSSHSLPYKSVLRNSHSRQVRTRPKYVIAH